MQCETKLVKNIVANCSSTPSRGIEETVYLFNRKDIASFAIDPEGVQTLCTDFTMVDNNAVAYKLKGYKYNLSISSEIVTSEDLPDTWTQSLNFYNYQFDSASVENIDNMGDIVAIAERKGVKEGDGTFVILGMTNGLFKSADTYNSNENNGARSLTISSLAGAGEPNSIVIFAKFAGTPAVADYAATKAYLESLTTPRNV